MMRTRRILRLTVSWERFVVILTTALFVLGLTSTPVNAQVRSTPNSAKPRADFESTRRKIEQGRREMEQKRRAMQKDLSRANLDPKSPPELNYRFSPGRQFAYLVQMEWQSAGKTNRILGRPFYHVRYQSRSKFATMVIGKFRHSVKTNDEEVFRELPQNDYWTQSVQVFGDEGVEGFGRDTKGSLQLPFLMTEFVAVPALTVPTLPAWYGKEGKEEPAALMLSPKGPTLWDGFTSDPDNTGRVTRFIEAKSLTNSLAQLDVTRGFVIEKTGFSAMYVSQGTFDLAEGLLQQSQGMYELKEDGKSTRVSVIVRRLSGADFELAKQDAIQSLGHLPEDVVPVQLARKPLELWLPDHYSVEEPAGPNQVAGYYDERMRQYFEVVALKRLAFDQMQIRFQGSGEIQTVHPATLVKINDSKPQ